METKSIQITNAGIFTTDKDFNILSWNSIMEIFTGISEKEIKGKNLFEAFPEIQERGLDKKFKNVIETGQIEFLSSVFHKYLIKIKPIDVKFGLEWMLQSVSIAPLFDGNKIVGTIVTLRDVSSQRKAELSRSKEGTTKTFEHIEKENLLEKLGDQDWRVRKEAVKSLQMTDSDIIEEILIKIKNSHKNLSILNSALQVLLGHSDKVVESLHDLIKSQDKDLRIYAAQTLGEIRDPDAIPILIKALQDPDKNVVYHAIESLGKLKAYDAIDKLIEIALKDDFFTSFAALDALRNMGEKIVLLHINKLINRDVFHPLIVEILSDIGDDSAIPILIDLINKSPQNLFDIAEALIKIYNRYDENFKEGKYILSIISQNLNQSAKELLIKSLEKRDNPKFKFLLNLLSLVGDDETLKIVFNFLMDSELRKIIINSLTKRGDDASKLLLTQLERADYDLKLEILKLAGNLTSPETIKILMDYLDEDDEEILTTVLNSLARIGSRQPYEKILNLLGHPSNVVRRSAISTLNSIGHPEMQNDIYKLLFSENLNELDSAIRIAGYFGFENCTARIIELCSHSNDQIRATALEHIGFFESKETIDILEKAMQDSNPNCRVAAVKSLVYVNDKRIYKLLLDALKDENHWVRINAIRAIQFLRFFEGAEEIIRLLENEKVIPVIVSAIKALGDIGGPSVVATLVKFIDDENKDIAINAIEALGDVKHPYSVQPLLELLHSIDTDIRHKALESLGKIKYDSTVEIIKLFALTEANEVLRKKSINILAQFNSEKAVQALIELLSEHKLKEDVIEALSKQDKKLLYVFERALTEEPVHIKLNILEALTLMRNPEGTKLIIQTLDDENAIVRIYAINSLRKLGSKEAIKKISYLSQNDRNEQVREVAMSFLKTIM